MYRCVYMCGLAYKIIFHYGFFQYFQCYLSFLTLSPSVSPYFSLPSLVLTLFLPFPPSQHLCPMASSLEFLLTYSPRIPCVFLASDVAPGFKLKSKTQIHKHKRTHGICLSRSPYPGYFPAPSIYL